MIKKLTQYITSPMFSLHCISLLFLLPFLPLVQLAPIPSFYSEWIAATLGILASVTLLKRQVWREMAFPQIAFVLLGLLILILMQWLLGKLHSAQYAGMVVAYMCWALLLMFVGSAQKIALGWRVIAQKLAWVVIVGAMINIALLVLQSFSFNQWLTPLKVVNTQLTAYLAFGIASVWYLKAQQKLSIQVAALLTGIFLFVMFYLSPYLAGFMVFVLGASLMTQPHKMRYIKVIIASLLLLSAMSFMALQWLQPTFYPSLLTSDCVKNVHMIFATWQASAAIFLKFPLLGVGFGQLPWASFMAIERPVSQGFIGVITNTHNQWLLLFTEMGVGAIALVCVGLFGWLKAFKAQPISHEARWILALLTLIFALSMTENILLLSPFLGISAFLLALGDAQGKAMRLPKIGRVSSAIVVVLGIVLLTTSLIAYRQLSAIYPLAQLEKPTAAQQRNIDDVLESTRKYSLLAPYTMPIYAETLTLNPDVLNVKLWLSNAAQRLSPSKKLAYRHVLLLKLAGKDAEAAQYLRRSLFAYPGKFEQELEAMPFAYWQDYLELLTVASPVKPPSTKKNP